MADVVTPRIIYSGDTYPNGATKRVESPDELADALSQGWRLSPEAVTTPPVETPADPFDRPQFDPQTATVAALRAYLETVTDAAELDRLAEAEAAHPAYEDGRAGALSAIADRRAALEPPV